MYLAFITSELKKWLRDPLLSFMLAYPVVFALLGRYGVPWLADMGGLHRFDPGELGVDDSPYLWSVNRLFNFRGSR